MVKNCKVNGMLIEKNIFVFYNLYIWRLLHLSSGKYFKKRNERFNVQTSMRNGALVISSIIYWIVKITGEGSTTLNDYKVVVGGDQLTRVRLQESKHLRNIAVNPQRRFEDLHPIVVEMWHNKQDLLDVSINTHTDHCMSQAHMRLLMISSQPEVVKNDTECWL